MIDMLSKTLARVNSEEGKHMIRKRRRFWRPISQGGEEMWQRLLESERVISEKVGDMARGFILRAIEWHCRPDVDPQLKLARRLG